MRATILLLSALAYAACSHLPPTPPTPEPGCIATPPPELPRIADVDCAEVYCLDAPGALALEAYLRGSQRWMREAWRRCALEASVRGLTEAQDALDAVLTGQRGGAGEIVAPGGAQAP